MKSLEKEKKGAGNSLKSKAAVLIYGLSLERHSQGTRVVPSHSKGDPALDHSHL